MVASSTDRQAVAAGSSLPALEPHSVPGRFRSWYSSLGQHIEPAHSYVRRTTRPPLQAPPSGRALEARSTQVGNLVTNPNRLGKPSHVQARKQTSTTNKDSMEKEFASAYRAWKIDPEGLGADGGGPLVSARSAIAVSVGTGDLTTGSIVRPSQARKRKHSIDSDQDTYAEDDQSYLESVARLRSGDGARRTPEAFLLRDLEDDGEEGRQVNDTLATQSTMQREFAAKERDWDQKEKQLQRENLSLENALGKMKQQLSQVEADHARDILRRANEHDSKIDQLRNDLASARRELQQKQKAHAVEVQTLHGRITNKDQHLAGLKKSDGNSKRKLSAAQTDLSGIRAMSAKKDAEINHLRTKLTTLTKEKNTEAQQLRQVQQVLKDKDAEIEHLRSHMQGAMKEKDAEIAKLNARKEELKSQFEKEQNSVHRRNLFLGKIKADYAHREQTMPMPDLPFGEYHTG